MIPKWGKCVYDCALFTQSTNTGILVCSEIYLMKDVFRFVVFDKITYFSGSVCGIIKAPDLGFPEE